MDDTDRKITNKVLQLGSLNDDLKRVVELTNQENKELEELDLKIDDKRKELETLDREIMDFKNRNGKEEFRHQEQIRKLKNELVAKQADADQMCGFILKLESNKKHLQEEVAFLKKDKTNVKELQDKLNLLQETIQEKGAQYNKLEMSVSKLITKESELIKSVAGLIDKFNSLKKELGIEKGKHRLWLKETKENAEKILASSVSKTDSLYKQKRDLRIVAKRLKKLWEHNSSLPFPKIYDA